MDAVLKIHVTPKSKKDHIAGMHGDAIKIQISAPPVDNKANDAIVALIAKKLRVPKRDVTIKSGATGRDKTVVITGMDSETAKLKLLSD